MNDRQNRRHQMFIRVREFFAPRENDFSPGGMARQLFAQLKAVITELDSLVAAQASGVGQARQRTQTRGDARLALTEDLQAINRAARAMGLAEQFPVPPFGNDRNLIAAGRSAASSAVALKADFILHEMPDNFIEELNDNITALETEIAEQSGAVDDHVNAAAAIDDKIDTGFEIVRKLDGLVRNKYADNPGVLAEWAAASHTERAPRRSTPTPVPAPTGGPTPPPVPPVP
jgi:hypothetical protein